MKPFAPAQITVLQALAAGATVTAAAELASVSRPTVYNWSAEPAFQQALAFARQEYALTIRDRMQAFTVKALDKLEQVLDHPKASPSVLRFVDCLAPSSMGGSLNGILSLYSGPAMAFATSQDRALRGQPNRPNRLRDARLSTDRSRTEFIARYFDTTEYAPNQIGQFGNAPRADGQLRGPGSAGVTLGIFKRFRQPRCERGFPGRLRPHCRSRRWAHYSARAEIPVLKQRPTVAPFTDCASTEKQTSAPLG